MKATNAKIYVLLNKMNNKAVNLDSDVYLIDMLNETGSVGQPQRDLFTEVLRSSKVSGYDFCLKLADGIIKFNARHPGTQISIQKPEETHIVTHFYINKQYEFSVMFDREMEREFAYEVVLPKMEYLPLLNIEAPKRSPYVESLIRQVEQKAREAGYNDRDDEPEMEI